MALTSSPKVFKILECLDISISFINQVRMRILRTLRRLGDLLDVNRFAFLRGAMILFAPGIEVKNDNSGKGIS